MESAVFSEVTILRERNVLKLKEMREIGRPVVGTYCLYSPAELIVAAGAVPVCLCGTSQNPIPAAEQVLPRNLCPLIKSSYGFATTDTCPFFHFADLLVAETTCDGKKKMYELLSEYKPLHLMQLPQVQEGEGARGYWLQELYRLRDRLEETFKVEITQEKLHDAIGLLNTERRALKDLLDLCKTNPSPITGMDLLTVLHNRGFCVDKTEVIDLMERLTAELRQQIAAGESPFRPGTPRILLTGVPVGIGSDKVVRLIEECGGSVVCFESCGAYKTVPLVEEGGDPMEAIAERYLALPCSCMSPNRGRFELVERLAMEFQADGIIDLTWHGCHTYNVESYSLKRYLENRGEIPFLQVETDYSESDTEQLRLRIEAFLEILLLRPTSGRVL
jgi:benzoyl-CoA reductase/2-hydroxyglutaryl-CoA dehydratase subunit BcrC/BadD/HgdB